MNKVPSANSQYSLDSLPNIIDYYSNFNDDHIVVGDFTLEPSEVYLESKLNYFNLIKNNTCFEGPGSCIDLIHTNRKHYFQDTSLFETGIQ